MSDQKILGVLFLSGVRHAALYLPTFLAHPAVKVLGVCEEDTAPGWMLEDSKAAANRFGVPFLGDLSAALHRDEVDLVVVCSEPVRHARLVIQALEAGKHVLVDKPLGVNLAEASQIAKVAATAPGKLTVIHRLFSPAIQRARKSIDADQVGLVLNADLEFISNGSRFAIAVERPELVADPALSGGGEILNFLVYPADYLRYLTGLEVVEVYAEASQLFFEPHARYGVEDCALVSVLLENTVTATITVGRVPYAPTAGPIASSLRLLGSHGFLSLNEEQPVVQYWGEDANQRGWSIAGEAGEVAFQTEIKEFIRDILEDHPPLYTIQDAWATMAVIEAAYESVRQGQPVKVARLAPN